MRGTAAAILALLLVVLALGTFAWMTHYPEAPIIERAAEWPWVGPIAERFRAAYVGPPNAGDDVVTGGEGGIDYEIVYESDPRLGGPDDPIDLRAFPGLEGTRTPRGALPFVWVRAGEQLFERDDLGAPVVHEYPEPERLAVIEQREDWYRVLPHDRARQTLGEAEKIGWVHLPNYTELSDPPFGRAPRRLGPLPSEPPAPELLAAARALLDGEREWRVGPYRVYSDGGDEPLFAWLDRVVSNLEPTYRRRYGLTPRGEPREVIVLFRREGQYRRFQASGFPSGEGRLADLSVGGHAFRGLAATWIGDRSAELLGGVVLHELVHLVNRRAIGPALPPWLDEGLAEDIAISMLAPDGAILVDRIGGARREVGGSTVVVEGGLGSVALLQERLGARHVPSLDEILGTDWGSMAERRDLHYAYAGLLMRYLQRPGAREGRALRGFLADVADGESAEGGVFLENLGVDRGTLLGGFEDWVYGIRTES